MERVGPRDIEGKATRAGASELGNERVSKPVGRTVARVSAEEHMANYQAARALLGKGRNASEGAA